MSASLSTFLRDELAELLRVEIESQGSDATVEQVGVNQLRVTDDDGERFTVTVEWNPAR